MKPDSIFIVAFYYLDPLKEIVTTFFPSKTNIRLTSQFSRGDSRVLQTLLKYFNDTITSTFLKFLLLGVLPSSLILNLNDSESVIGLLGYYMYYCHKLTNILE